VDTLTFIMLEKLDERNVSKWEQSLHKQDQLDHEDRSKISSTLGKDVSNDLISAIRSAGHLLEVGIQDTTREMLYTWGDNHPELLRKIVADEVRGGLETNYEIKALNVGWCAELKNLMVI
jgi:hypothetical protein